MEELDGGNHVIALLVAPRYASSFAIAPKLDCYSPAIFYAPKGCVCLISCKECANGLMTSPHEGEDILILEKNKK